MVERPTAKRGDGERQSFLRSLWPDMAEETGRRDGIIGGLVAAGWVAFATVIGLATGDYDAGPDIDPGTATVLGFVAAALLLGLLGALAWRLWTRHSVVSAWIILLLVLIEQWSKFLLLAALLLERPELAPEAAKVGTFGWLVTIVVTLAAIHGVRAAHAYRRARLPS